VTIVTEAERRISETHRRFGPFFDGKMGIPFEGEGDKVTDKDMVIGSVVPANTPEVSPDDIKNQILKLAQKGVKYDQEKTMWSLLPKRELEAAVRVLMMGLKKYSRDNWKYVKPKERYMDALMRHVMARMDGEMIDPESGEPHLSHAICCSLFLAWHDTEDGSNKEAVK